MRALKLLASLVKGVEGPSVRSYFGDFVRCLHIQICDMKESQIDQHLNSSHYGVLLEIFDALQGFDKTYYMISEDFNEI